MILMWKPEMLATPGINNVVHNIWIQYFLVKAAAWTTEIMSAWRSNRSFSTTIFLTIGSDETYYATSWDNHDNSIQWMRVDRFSLHYSFSEFLQESVGRQLPGLRGVYVLSFVCRRLSHLRLPRLSADQSRRTQRQTGVGWHTETLRIR